MCIRDRRKGEPVMIDGSLRVDKWEDKQTGQKRNKMKVVGHQITFLGSAEKKPAESRPAPQPEPASVPAAKEGDMDEIPF